MSGADQIAVLHAALYPVTGPWSVMRDLALAQAESGRYAGVGLAVITDASWPADYREEIRKTPLAFYESSCPKMFGTAAFLFQRIRPPPWRSWIQSFAARTGASRVIVHLHNAWMSGVFLPLPEVPGVRTAVVSTFHGVNEHFRSKPVRKALHRWMARRLLEYGASLTSVDGINTRLAEDLFGIPLSSFAVIPNGLGPSAAEACPSLKKEGRALTVGHVGSLIPQKGWPLLAKAAEALNHSTVQVRVKIAGRGPDEEAVRDWTACHSSWADYLGFVPEPRERVMPGLDALCLMSQWEGLPMAVIEAMSVGLPVIATDVGGVSEAVRHNETGLLIPRNADALVAALSDLLHDRSRLAAMSARARQVFMEHFTMDRVMERYRAVYEEALA